MARIKIIRGTNLPDTTVKTDCHNLIDGATAQIYDIVNSEVKSDAAIVDTKLNTISTIGKVNLTALACASQAAGDILYMNNAGQVVRLPIGTAGQKLRVGNIQMDYFEYVTDLLAQTTYPTNSNSAGTGGTITTVGNDVVHTFTSSGTFVPLVSGNYKVLVVAGGGGGASGGGGGGGVVYTAAKSLTGGQSYTVTIGGGGAGASNGSQGAYPNKGGNSVFGDITAEGGGKAGNTDAPNRAGGDGGNGGGAGQGSVGTKSGGSGTQGYNGGASTIDTAPWTSGGGGGAGAVGQPGGASNSGNGGDGVLSTIYDNTNLYYGGGGGGGSGNANTTGGAGGGGAGSASTTGTAGTANTGGGGGGANSGSTGGAGGSGIVIVRYPAVLNCYSESSIKSQGTYALKGVAQATDSLNDTLTRTVSPTINLTGINTLKFDIRASRTGSNIKIGIHDSGGTTTETTPNITSANAWQTVTWDISGVANANKDAIDSIIITIVNADVVNTFYLDNFFIYGATNILEWVTP